MRLKLSKDASLFLRDERRYLERFNPRAADAVLRQLRAALRHLTQYPHSGPPHETLRGRRCFVSGDYLIHYRINGAWVLVSRIHHGRQKPPELGAEPESDTQE